MATVEPLTPAGFWRRFVAIVLDLIIVTLIIGMIGVGLATATDGKVRVGNALLDFSICANEAQPSELQLPRDFRATSIVRCTKYFFGMPHDWLLNITERTQIDPTTTYTRQFTVPLNPAGQITNPFYLDHLFLFAFAAYIFLFERQYDATVGKRILGLRVRSLDGAALQSIQAGKRTVMRMIPLLPLVAISLYLMVVDPMKAAILFFDPPMTNFWVTTVVGGLLITVLMLTFAVNFMVTARRRTPPWHDRWAGTEVVRR
jgi:uncharacterized RDD family membrane protein YckC